MRIRAFYKIGPLLICVFIILCGLAIFWATAIFRFPYSKKHVKVLGRELSVWVVDNDRARQQGLQNILWLPKDTGILFVYPQAGRYCIWNKHTFLPLKIIFMKQGKVVEASRLPPFWKGRVTVCPRESVDSIIETKIF